MAKPILLTSLALSLYTKGISAFPQYGRSQLEFDYVVVGSGPGGLTIASRLTEDPSVSVAVIEAGTWAEKGTGNQSQVPGYDYYYGGKGANETNPLADWGFLTTPQVGMNDQVVHYARGKSLGGSSNLNYMGYAHTCEGAFQMWADAVQDQSYTYDTTSKYYRKSMNFTGPNQELRLQNATVSYEPSEVATGGPLDVTFSTWAQSWSTWIAASMNKVGPPNTETFLNGKLNGSSWVPDTINPRNGHRESAATAFLEPYVNRPNLKVFDLTLGERIIFDANKTARGVEVTTGDRTYTISAKREVIVSGGTFQSPQLLQVSGVGPAELLKKHNITVIADRPGVGQGMNDHIFFGIAYRVNIETLSALKYGDADSRAIEQFNANGTGPLSNTASDYFAYEKLPQDIRQDFSPETLAELAKLPEDWPEMQYLTLGNYAGNFEHTTLGSPQDGYMYAELLTTLITPTSRGSVNISSPRMSDHPLINPNWLTTQHDIDLVIGGFKRVRQILESDVMANVTIGPEYYPGPSVQTDEQIHEQIKKSFDTMFHVSSTCKMGTSDDKDAVVDNHARVYGVNGLRVVDASAFPFLPPGLPQATVYMLAEKIADDIKAGN
ncbi:putative choline dehydrogenase [Hypoxylon trugodes]|uniref:putative choline dehydrogenase n=1 Tax=Hypoxylon trugodes TaxID=326681 RepID=UPI0021908D50|nr:putative choline dehydrogenase [Hypoxylon trugodes]KAI1387625.1 putative choline dehydrogenase [Hypoxylon trugodes]